MNRKGGGVDVWQSVAKISSPLPSGSRMSQITASIGARGVRIAASDRAACRSQVTFAPFVSSRWTIEATTN